MRVRLRGQVVCNEEPVSITRMNVLGHTGKLLDPLRVLPILELTVPDVEQVPLYEANPATARR